MQGNPWREMLHGTTDLLVLAMLGRRAMHGYGIRKGIIRLSHGLIVPGFGNVYRLLKMLERRGHIRGTDVIVGTTRWRRTYSVTAKGRAELIKRMNEWRGFASAVKAVLQSERLSRNRVSHGKGERGGE